VNTTATTPTAAQQAAARLREDARRERIRSNLPDTFGPFELPGGCWKLGMEDDSVLIVAAGTGWAGQMQVREHQGFGHGLAPGQTRDMNCASCIREDAAAEAAGLGPMHPEDPGEPDTAPALTELHTIAAALNANPMRAYSTWEADAQRMAALIAQLTHAGAIPEHDCPRQEFLEDPITEAYGVGGEMLHLIDCAVCDAEVGIR
jgi:hypothetical protein